MQRLIQISPLEPHFRNIWSPLASLLKPSMSVFFMYQGNNVCPFSFVAGPENPSKEL